MYASLHAIYDLFLSHIIVMGVGFIRKFPGQNILLNGINNSKNNKYFE